MSTQTVGPSTAREASSTIIAGSDMTKFVTQPDSESNQRP